jgi:hypothetical protein
MLGKDHQLTHVLLVSPVVLAVEDPSMQSWHMDACAW